MVAVAAVAVSLTSLDYSGDPIHGTRVIVFTPHRSRPNFKNSIIIYIPLVRYTHTSAESDGPMFLNLFVFAFYGKFNFTFQSHDITNDVHKLTYYCHYFYYYYLLNIDNNDSIWTTIMRLFWKIHIRTITGQQFPHT